MLRLLIMLAVVLTTGCGDDAAPAADAGIDAAMDAGAVGRDAGRCDPACGDDEACCGPVDALMCIPVLTDPVNCGGCGIVCADGLGTDCDRGLCICGNSKMGCGGTRNDFCCPPRTAGGLNYCADLDQDGDDCGGCGAACDPLAADRCDGGRCLCGFGRDGCDGTAESSCCVDSGGEYGCVDTTTDRFHCGGCEEPCQLDEVCEESTCSRGTTPCAGGCPAPSDICCDGVCCARALCDMDMCP